MYLISYKIEKDNKTFIKEDITNNTKNYISKIINRYIICFGYTIHNLTIKKVVNY